jgi:hypothetical protein
MRKLPIFTIILSILGLLVASFGKKAMPVEYKDLSFDIDFSSLSYELPYHTKLCIPEVKHRCSEEGCVKIKPKVFVLYDEISKTVYRCDEKPCDSYSVNEYTSGIFTYLRPTDVKDLSIKIADDPAVGLVNSEMSNQYIEMAGSMLSVMVSNGRCIDK